VEIREYQIANAKKVNTKDITSEYKTIGIIKTKLHEELAYSGISIYDLKKNQIIFTQFKSFKPIFTEYFPTVLFLNQTDIYLDLIQNLKSPPDCYIINSSGQIHPFFYGSACDFGLKIEIPVIGYTNKLLIGELKKKENDDSTISEVNYQDYFIGYGIIIPGSKKMFYVSVGNNISLQTALKIFLNLDYNVMRILKVELNAFIKSSI
jgi:deoxyribonuclease V